ncbi:MAG: hypothetical protein V4608_01800 [Bacteroidota bacterium]
MKPTYSDPEDKEDLRTLTSCLNNLAKEGFATQFKALKNGLKSLTTDRLYQKDDIKIVSFYRFEGESDPSDNSILYAIETSSGERGTLTDAYGAYSDPNVSNFIKEVENIAKREHKNE